MAHRSQLKRCKADLEWSLPNVVLRKLRDDELTDQELEGTTRVDEKRIDDDPGLSETTPKGGVRSKKRKLPTQETGFEGVRRSKRTKKEKRDVEYCYGF